MGLIELIEIEYSLNLGSFIRKDEGFVVEEPRPVGAPIVFPIKEIASNCRKLTRDPILFEKMLREGIRDELTGSIKSEIDKHSKRKDKNYKFIAGGIRKINAYAISDIFLHNHLSVINDERSYPIDWIARHDFWEDDRSLLIISIQLYNLKANE